MVKWDVTYRERERYTYICTYMMGATQLCYTWGNGCYVLNIVDKLWSDDPS